eukprot:TRINITY_DN16116_c0_g1_i1.p2 TRINITY_DN16116_c0_g1~~TRINITY_DN16116_c0_g1_i1.p2  ORF type:complete len:100 (+),score=8.22 TRINITY_DN16116_c0_g1_i1:341-640(+)
MGELVADYTWSRAAMLCTCNGDATYIKQDMLSLSSTFASSANTTAKATRKTTAWKVHAQGNKQARAVGEQSLPIFEYGYCPEAVRPKSIRSTTCCRRMP